MRSELERYKAALAVAQQALLDLGGYENRSYSGPRMATARHDIDAILNPPPELEEVKEIEVERFVLFFPDGTTSQRVFTRDEIEGHNAGGGTFKRVVCTMPDPRPSKKVTVRFEGAAGSGKTLLLEKVMKFLESELGAEEAVGQTGDHELVVRWRPAK